MAPSDNSTEHDRPILSLKSSKYRPRARKYSRCPVAYRLGGRTLTTVSRIDVGLADRRSPKIVITLRHSYLQAARVEHGSALELRVPERLSLSRVQSVTLSHHFSLLQSPVVLAKLMSNRWLQAATFCEDAPLGRMELHKPQYKCSLLMTIL